MLFMNIDTKVLYRILATGSLSFLNGSAGKESACNAGDTGNACFDPWVEKIPWRRKMAMHSSILA